MPSYHIFTPPTGVDLSNHAQRCCNTGLVCCVCRPYLGEQAASCCSLKSNQFVV